MAKASRGKSIIGSVGAVMIGAAVLLFACTLILNNLKGSADPGQTAYDNTSNAARNSTWAEFNATVGQIQTILTAAVILLAVLGIVLVGAAIIGTIGGAFGG
jgi:hypothetical protein